MKLGKKLTAFGLSAALMVSVYAGAYATEPSIGIKKQGQLVPADQPPIIVESRVLVPVRVIAETLGFPVHWDALERQVIVNNRVVAMDVEPRIVAGRAMVPVRAIAEHLGIQIAWYPATREVTLDVDLAATLKAAAADIERFIAWAEADYGVAPSAEPVASEDVDIEVINRFIHDRFAALTEARRSIEWKTQLIQGFYADELPANTSLTIVIDWLEQAAEAMVYRSNKQFVELTQQNALEILHEAAAELEISVLLLERN